MLLSHERTEIRTVGRMGFQGLSPARVRSFASTLRSAAGTLEEQAIRVRRAQALADIDTDVARRLDDRSETLLEVAIELEKRAALAEQQGFCVGPDDIASIRRDVFEPAEFLPAPFSADRWSFENRDPMPSGVLADTAFLPNRLDEDPLWNARLEESQRVVDAIDFIRPLVTLNERFYHRLTSQTLRVEEADAARIRERIAHLSEAELDRVVNALTPEQEEDFWFAVSGGLDTRVKKPLADTATLGGQTDFDYAQIDSARRVSDAHRLINEAIAADTDEFKPVWAGPSDETNIWIYRVLDTLTFEEQDTLVEQLPNDILIEFILPIMPHRPLDDD